MKAGIVDEDVGQHNVEDVRDANGIVGTDALGRPIFAGQIFNPATTRLVNGIPVRDPYPGNVIPANDPLRSVVASRIVPLMVHPDRAGISNNVAGNPAGDQTWELDARNIMNHPTPGAPNLNINSGTFGQIITKTGSRALAGQLRLEF